MPILISTNRLLIKVPIVDDIDNWYALHSDPEVMQFMGGPKDRIIVKEWLLHDIMHYKKYGFCMGSVFEINTKTFVGRAGLVHLNHDETQPDIEIGYALHKAYWNRGYATELVLATIDWGFKHLDVNKLVAVTRPVNKKSQHVLEKSGMKYRKKIIFNHNAFLFYEIFKPNN